MTVSTLVGQIRTRVAPQLATYVPIVAAIAAILLIAGSCSDRRRAAYADGQLVVLQRSLEAAQREQHDAAVAVVAAQRALDSVKAHADAVVAHAAQLEQQSKTLAAQVHIVDATHLAVRVTPTAPDSAIGVPPPVVAYIASLEQTVAAKDSALQARDGQVATSATETAALRREVAADSVMIDEKDKENAALKEKIPRFGFRSGFVAGVAVLVGIVRLLK
jgi:hypothetical protein